MAETSGVDVARKILELQTKINAAKQNNLKIDAQDALELARLLQIYHSMEEHYLTINKHAEKLNKLTEINVKDNLTLKKIVSDKVSALNKEFLSEQNLHKLVEERYELNNKIGKLQEEFNKTSDIGISAELSSARASIDELDNSIRSVTTQMEMQETLSMGLNVVFGKNAESVKKIANAFGLTNNVASEFIKHLSSKNYKDAFKSLFSGTSSVKDSIISIIGTLKSGFIPALRAVGAAFAANPIGAIVVAAIALKEIFESISEILFQQNAEVTELERTLMISGKDARDIRSEFVMMERTSKSAFATTANFIKANTELVGTFGAALNYATVQNDALVASGRTMLDDQILMTRQVGLTAEETGQLQRMTTFLNTNYDEFATNASKANMELKSQKGISFNLKSLLSDISKISAATFLSFNKYPGALYKAVVTAQELGVSIDQMNGMSDKLLDIESSLSAQFEATVLAQRDFNFEKARELALDNQIGEAASEVLRQVGSASEYATMNRVTQESIAKAVGLTREELSNSLIVQENLSKLSESQRKEFERITDGMSEQEKSAYALKMTDADRAKNAIQQISAQEKMNQMQEKLYSILGNTLTVLEPIVDSAADFLQRMSGVMGILGNIISAVINVGAAWYGFFYRPAIFLFDLLNSINTMFTGNLLDGVLMLGQAIVDAILSPFMIVTNLIDGIGNSIFGMFTKTGKAFNTTGWLKDKTKFAPGEMDSIDDGVITPSDGLVISSPKGTYQLDKNDGIIAGTGIGKESVKTQNSSVDLTPVINSINRLTDAILSNQQVLKIDGKEFAKIIRNVTDPKVVRA